MRHRTVYMTGSEWMGLFGSRRRGRRWNAGEKAETSARLTRLVVSASARGADE